jgi:uncharacterized membrane protein
MDSNPLVAGMVGLVTASSIYIWQTDRFNKAQKTLLLLCFVFPPLQWVMILIVHYYNEMQYKKTKEFKKEVLNYNEEKKIDNSKTTLQELKDSGLITEEEYKTKVEKIDNQKTELTILNSKEYSQLKSLLDSNILTKEEFENKVELLRCGNTKIEIVEKVAPPQFNPVEFDSLESENKSSTVKTYFLSFLALIGLYLLIYLFFNNGNIGNENIDGQPTAIDSTYINNSYQNTTYVEPLKIKKFVYIVTKVSIPTLHTEQIGGYTDYSTNTYTPINYYYLIEWEKHCYSTEINEIDDYNEDEKYKFLDKIENNIKSNFLYSDGNYESSVNTNCNSESKKVELLENKSKITYHQIFEFDTYAEASLSKQANLDINPK